MPVTGSSEPSRLFNVKESNRYEKVKLADGCFFIVQKRDCSVQDLDYLSSRGIHLSDEAKKLYITYGGTPWLDGAHTVFGYVYEGMDTVDYIASCRVNGAGKPLDGDVVIQNIEIKTY